MVGRAFPRPEELPWHGAHQPPDVRSTSGASRGLGRLTSQPWRPWWRAQLCRERSAFWGVPLLSLCSDGVEGLGMCATAQAHTGWAEARACVQPVVANTCLWGDVKAAVSFPPARSLGRPPVITATPSQVFSWLCFTGAQPWGGGVCGDRSLPPHSHAHGSGVRRGFPGRVCALQGPSKLTAQPSQKPSPLRAT